MTAGLPLLGGFAQGGAAIRTPYGTLIPPAGQVVAYVRSTGANDRDPPHIATMLHATLASALSKCRAGKGDTIIVLPGHTENVVDATMLDNLVAGTRIVGAGNVNQDDAPQFHWTATGSSWTVDQKNVTIQNLRLLVSEVAGVVKGIDVTAAAMSFLDNFVETASSATLKATIVMEIGTAVDCVIAGNFFWGLAEANSTNGILIDGVASRIRITNNRFDYSVTEVNGQINITAAALGILIDHNLFMNTETSSTCNINLADVASDGMIIHNVFGQENDGTLTAQGIIFVSTGSLVMCAENYAIDERAKSGIVSPAVDT